jgi:hypothetical protein
MFGEDLATAKDGVAAAEAARDHQEVYDPPRKRQIGHAARYRLWKRRTLYNRPTRHQTGAVERLLHGADSPQSKRQTSPKLHQK